MKSTKPYISPSQLDMLSRCQMQYRFRYLDGIKGAPGVAMVLGTGVHKSIEKNLKHKMANKGALLPLSDVKDAAAEATKNAWAGEGPMLQPEEKERGEKVVKGEAIDTAVSLAALHHERLAPILFPTHVERECNVELRNFPYDLRCFTDVSEPGAIRDTKTSSKSYADDSAKKSTQLAFNHFAHKVIDGQAPPTVKYDVLVKKATPEVQTVSAELTDDDHRRLLDRVAYAAKVIQAGNFMPASADSWFCNSRWCFYHESICPFGARKRVQG